MSQHLTDPTNAAELEAVLAELRAEYEITLPAKLAELAGALHAARSAEGDARAFAQARLLAHRLGGTAGSYGFFEFGRAAARIEELFTEAQPGEALPRGGWDAVDRAFEDVKRAAQA